MAPDGRFQTSGRVRINAHWVTNLVPILVDGLFEQYYTSNLVRTILRTGPETTAINTPLSFALPPLVRITAPTPGAYWIRDVHGLYRRREPWRRHWRSSFGSTTARRSPRATNRRSVRTLSEKVVTATLTALPGSNELRATATSLTGVEGVPAITHAEWPRGSPTSDLYVIAVGINKYTNAQYNLNFARPDAEEFAKTLRRVAAPMFRQILVSELYCTDDVKPIRRRSPGCVKAR